MAYTEEQLTLLEAALAKGEKRVTFGDKTVEYRSVDELKEAIRAVERGLAEQAAEFGDPGHQKPFAVVIRIWRLRLAPALRASSDSTVRIAACSSSTERYSTVFSAKLTRRSPVASARLSASSWVVV